MSYTWLITGASSGLGASLALCALKSGHTVIACSRDIVKAKKAIPEVEKLRGTWLELDVTQVKAEKIISDAVELHHVNVLVNSACFAFRGTLEEISMNDAKVQFETNFYGALRCMKGAIPHFRGRHQGTIVNVSSIAGIRGAPPQPLFSASSFALEGASESVAADLAPLNIRVLIVQPGAFRTNIHGSVKERKVDSPEPLRDTTTDTMQTKATAEHGKEPGDIDKAAKAIVDAVTGKEGVKVWKGLLRLPLGKDAYYFAEMKYRGVLENLDRTKDVAFSTDFDE